MLTRRKFLQATTLGAAGLAGGLNLVRVARASIPDDWKTAFDQAIKTDRRLLGWQGVTV